MYSHCYCCCYCCCYCYCYIVCHNEKWLLATHKCWTLHSRICKCMVCMHWLHVLWLRICRVEGIFHICNWLRLHLLCVLYYVCVYAIRLPLARGNAHVFTHRGICVTFFFVFLNWKSHSPNYCHSLEHVRKPFVWSK